MTVLVTKNSVTTTNVPATLTQGELAVNVVDSKLWVGGSDSVPVLLFDGPINPGTTTDDTLRWDGSSWAATSLVTSSSAGALVVTGGLSSEGDGTDSFRAGTLAGVHSQGGGAVAIGSGAGKGSAAAGDFQGANAVAIGTDSGQTAQAARAISIGFKAGSLLQANYSIAIGSEAGYVAQALNGIIISSKGSAVNDSTVGHIHLISNKGSIDYTETAGWTATEGAATFALNPLPINNTWTALNTFNAGLESYGSGGTSTVRLGNLAGATSMGTNSVAIGDSAGLALGLNSIAIGKQANQSGANNSIGIGLQAGETNQGIYTVALGHLAGKTNQADGAIAIGRASAENDQETNAVAIGANAGKTSQKVSAVSIGINAGQNNQASQSVAIGSNAGRGSSGADFQGANSIAIGTNAAEDTQGQVAQAIGASAGQFSQGQYSTAIGLNAAQYFQDTSSVAIGLSSGNGYQGKYCVAIGHRTAEGTPATDPVTAPLEADGQGDYAIAIGIGAGAVAQGEYGIILNTAGPGLNDATTGHIHINTTLASANFTTADGWTLKNGAVDSLKIDGTGISVNGGGVTLADGYFNSYGPNGNTSNVSIGQGALASADSDVTVYGQNVGIGTNAGANTTTGNANLAIGASSLLFNSTGNNNTAVGQGALAFAISSNNTCIGQGAGAGSYLSGGIGSNNTIIGKLAGTTGLINTVLIGAGANERIKVTVDGMSVNGTEAVGKNGGPIMPIFTTTARNALTGMIAGEMIYNSTTAVLNMYNGSAWVTV